MITVVMAKKQRIKYASNKYLSISENDAWLLLEKLDKIPTKFIIYIIRNICGYTIIKDHDEILKFIKNTKVGNITECIAVPGGILILKIVDKRYEDS